MKVLNICLALISIVAQAQIDTNIFQYSSGKVMSEEEARLAPHLLAHHQDLSQTSGSSLRKSRLKSQTKPVRFVAALRNDTTLAGLHDVEIQGDYAYVTGKGPWGKIIPGQGSFSIVNISDPRNPYVEGSITQGITNGETVLVDGDICYLGSNHFWSVDVSDPSNPKVLAKLEDPEIKSINGMTRLGDYLYAASKRHHITVFDIRDPHQPKLVRTFVPEGEVFRSPHDIDRLDDQRIVVANIVANRANDRLRVYRVAKPNGEPLPEEQWVLEGSINDERLRGANRVRARDNYALVVCNKGFSVGVVDFRKPGRPELTSWFPTDDRPRYKSCGMDVSGDVMIAVGWGVLGFFDISNLPEMTKIGEYEFEVPVPGDGITYRHEQLQLKIQPLISPDHDIVYRDGFIYTTDQNENVFAVYEVTDPGLRAKLDKK